MLASCKLLPQLQCDSHEFQESWPAGTVSAVQRSCEIEGVANIDRFLPLDGPDLSGSFELQPVTSRLGVLLLWCTMQSKRGVTPWRSSTSRTSERWSQRCNDAIAEMPLGQHSRTGSTEPHLSREVESTRRQGCLGSGACETEPRGGGQS